MSIHREDVRDHYLDLLVQTDDLEGPVTIREYLIALLATLWVEKDGFSGKRPFGNSGWHWDLYDALGRAGIVGQVVNGEVKLTNLDCQAAEKIILACIKRLGERR